MTRLAVIILVFCLFGAHAFNDDPGARAQHVANKLLKALDHPDPGAEIDRLHREGLWTGGRRQGRNNLRSLNHHSDEEAGFHEEDSGSSRPAAAFFSDFDDKPSAPGSEGLRLYSKFVDEGNTKLRSLDNIQDEDVSVRSHSRDGHRPALEFFRSVGFDVPFNTESSGRPQLRSLDDDGADDLNGFGSSSSGGSSFGGKTSATTWSRREERKQSRRFRTSSTRTSGSNGGSTQLRSLDNDYSQQSPLTVTATGGVTESHGPNFSEEVTYRRSSSGRRDSDGNGVRVSKVTRKCSTSTQKTEDGKTTTTHRQCIPRNGNGQAQTQVRSASSAGQTQVRSASSAGQTQVRSASAAETQQNVQQTSSTAIRNHQQSSASSTTLGATSNGNGVQYRCRSCVNRCATSGTTPSPNCIAQQSQTQTRSLQSQSSNLQARNLVIPPYRRMGRGDQQVEARVVDFNHEEEESAGQQRNGQSGAESEHSEYEHYSESGHSSHSSNNHEQVITTEAPPPPPPSQAAAASAYKRGRKLKKGYYRRTTVKNFTTQAFPSEEVYSFTSS